MQVYHLALSKEQLQGAKIALLPGDPARVPLIAREIEKNAKELAFNREYRSFLCITEEKPVVVCSTGIGGPSTSIAVEELAQLGIKQFIRIGTSGSIQSNVKVGTIVITSGAVRLDGTSDHFAPMEYPAVASPYLLFHIVKAARDLKIKHRVGITASSATFYQGQERYDSFSGYVPRHLRGSLEEWRKLNVLNYEMEAATLFVMCSSMGLKAGCICGIIAARAESEHVALDLKKETVKRTIQVASAAIKSIIKNPSFF